MSRTSSRDYLLNLPEVFTVSDLKRKLNFSDAVARVYLSRWHLSNYIKPWAPHSGMYFNLILNRNADKDYFSNAVLKRYPQSMLIGPQIIRAAGWITQISNTYSLALNVRPTRGSTLKGSGYPEPEGVSFEYRDRLWWKAALANRSDIPERELKQFGFNAVSPGFALVDMWKNRQSEWFPDPDDLYLDDYQGSFEDIEHACNLLNVDIDKFYIDTGICRPVQPSLNL